MRSFRPTSALIVLCLSIAPFAACDDSTGPSNGPPPVKTAFADETDESIFRTVLVTLDEPAAVEVFYQPNDGGRVLRMRADSLALVHRIMLPRLREATAYAFAVRSFDEAGASDSTVRGTFSTDSLPDALQALEYTTTGSASFPLVMVPFRVGDFTGQVAFEPDGAIVWYVAAGAGTLVAAPVPGSHDMLFIENGFPSPSGGNGIVRVNPRREVVAHLERTAASPFGQIHHDLTALDPERVLFIAFDTMTVRDTLVNGEALWEWNTTTGALTKRWSSWGSIDWDTERNPTAPASQWLHANSVTVGPRGNYIVSFRSLSQVISIAPDFQSLEWRVGGPGATVAIAESERFIGQHSATEVAPGRVLMFDNQGGGPGNDRSRALELDIQGDTAIAAFDYTPDPPRLSVVRGGTYRLPSGNTFTVFASLPFQIHESTPAGTVVWSMTGDMNFTQIFRATPWPSIAGEVEVAAMP